jgi:hypothetical protein
MTGLARESNEVIKSCEYRQLCMMQIGEKYADETRVMNEVQKVILPRWKSLVEAKRKCCRWHQNDFTD